MGPTEVPSGTVTFLFTDIEGSTSRWENAADTMPAALARHDELVRSAVATEGGTIFATGGDGFAVAFSTAAAAVRAAVAAQRSLGAEPWPGGAALTVRMGLHTGVAHERDGDFFGSEVNRAARIMSVAHGGQIVASRAVADLAGGDLADLVESLDLGDHRLRDLRSTVRLVQFAAPGLPREFPGLRSLDAYSSNLPFELSSLVGRDEEVDAARHLLEDGRLVTIVGVGGVGKTRLALRLAAEALPRFGDGAWLCELAAVLTPDEVSDAVATAVGYVPPQGTRLDEGLEAHLSTKELLLVLDNCEHLVAAVASFTSRVLSRTRSVVIVATSREPLGVSGERVLHLAPLAIPCTPDPGDVALSDSGALFARRALDATGTFTVDDSNAAAIHAICTHLDGIPLALELAAARTVAMHPTEIEHRLDQKFRLLTGGSRTALERHRTLRGAIDWSYDLLDETEAAVLRRCSVFVGGFDLEAATALVDDLGLDDLDVADALAQLVSKCLIEAAPGTEGTRYRALEMIRQYAADRLDDDGSASTVRDAHADYFLARAARLFGAAGGPTGFDALDHLDADADNLGAALRWMLDTGRLEELLSWFDDRPFVDPGLISRPVTDLLARAGQECVSAPGSASRAGFGRACFAASMRPFIEGDVEDYVRYSQLADADRNAPLPAVELSKSAAAVYQGDVEGALAYATAAVERARAVSSPAELAFALGMTAVYAAVADDHNGAGADLAAEGLALAEAHQSAPMRLYPLLGVMAAYRKVDPLAAIAAAEECSALDRSQRRLWGAAAAAATASTFAELGDSCQALRRARDAIAELVLSGDRFVLAVAISAAASAVALTHPTEAVRLVAILGCGAFGDFSSLPQEGPALSQLVTTQPEVVDDALRTFPRLDADGATELVIATLDRLIAGACPPGKAQNA